MLRHNHTETYNDAVRCFTYTYNYMNPVVLCQKLWFGSQVQQLATPYRKVQCHVAQSTGTEIKQRMQTDF